MPAHGGGGLILNLFLVSCTPDEVVVGELAVLIGINLLKHHLLLFLGKLEPKLVASVVELFKLNVVVLGLVEESEGLLQIAEASLNPDPENVK
jgi:hypothetical protein